MKLTLISVVCCSILYAQDIFIAEVFYNPANVDDNLAEFLEIYNPSKDNFSSNTTILLDSDTVFTGEIAFKEKNFTLLCAKPQSNFWNNNNLHCQNSSNFSKALPNSGTHILQLYQNTILIDSSTIKMESKTSSLNRLWPPRDQISDTVWLNSTYQFKEEYATPGFNNPDAINIANNSITIDSIANQNIYFFINSTNTNMIELNYSFAKDIDSINLLIQNSLMLSPGHKSISINSKDMLFANIRLNYDQFPLDDSLTLFLQDSLNQNIIFSGLNPCPSSDNSEWFKIKNINNNSIKMSDIKWKINDKYSFVETTDKILSNQEIAIVQDTFEFQEQFGDIRLPIYQPNSWINMSNSGSKIEMLFHEQIISEKQWFTDCENIGDDSTLFTNSKKITNSIRLNKRVIDSNTDNIYIKISLEKNSSVELRLYTSDAFEIWQYNEDLEGIKIIELPPNFINRLTSGIYILTYKFTDNSWKKISFVIKP